MGYLTHLLIDLDLDATPIAGYIATDHDARRPFHGWLELSSAIEERRTAGRGTPGLTGRTAAPWPSAPGSDSSQTSCEAPYPRARAGAVTGEMYRGVRHPGVAAWLAQCSTQPWWMLLGAWTCAGWSAVAVVAVAATRHTEVLAWWGLGLLAILVLLTVIWTEQQPTVGSDDGDPPARGGPPTRPEDRGSTEIDWRRLEHEMLTQATQTHLARRAGLHSATPLPHAAPGRASEADAARSMSHAPSPSSERGDARPWGSCPPRRLDLEIHDGTGLR